MSSLATRPLTVIVPAMYEAAWRVAGGALWARMSDCGRFIVYQAHVGAPDTPWHRWVIVADRDDLDAYARAYGGDLAAAGAAIRSTFTAQGVL